MPEEYPSLSPNTPINYQAIPSYNITWQEQPNPSYVSFPEDENSVVRYDESEVFDYNYANNDLLALNEESTLPQINQNDIEEGRNELVDGFWINDGTCISHTQDSFDIIVIFIYITEFKW